MSSCLGRVAICPCLPGTVLVYALLLTASLSFSKCSTLQRSLDLWLMESSELGSTWTCGWMQKDWTKKQWPLPMLLLPEKATCPSSPPPAASQFSSSPYVPGTFWAAPPALELRANESLSKWVYWQTPQEKCLGLRRPFSSCRCNPGCLWQPDVMGTPDFLVLVLPAGEPSVGLDPELLGDTSAVKISLGLLNRLLGYGTSPFHITAPPIRLSVASSLYY